MGLSKSKAHGTKRKRFHIDLEGEHVELFKAEGELGRQCKDWGTRVWGDQLMKSTLLYMSSSKRIKIIVVKGWASCSFEKPSMAKSHSGCVELPTRSLERWAIIILFQRLFLRFILSRGSSDESGSGTSAQACGWRTISRTPTILLGSSLFKLTSISWHRSAVQRREKWAFR